MTRLRRARRWVASALNFGLALCALGMMVLQRDVAEIDDEERRGE